MKRDQIIRAVTKAYKMANKWNDLGINEGSIIIQIKPHNRSLLVTYQLGNSWESMGLNANESQDRILYNFDCRDEWNYDDIDEFYVIVDSISNQIENDFVEIS